MDPVPIPAHLAAVLSKVTAPVSLVNEQGQLLGSFSPATCLVAKDEITPAELAAIKSKMTSPGPGRMTEDVVAHIQAWGQR